MARKKTKEKDDQTDLIHSSRLGRFSQSAARYTSSVDIDPRILRAVIDINLAHVLMLAKEKAITRESAASILSALKQVPKDLKLNELLEDVHMNVEDQVIRIAGRNQGGLLNMGKSRNDQIATALRIELRERLLEICRESIRLSEVLLARSIQNTSTVMPGYTHLQRAQPVTVAHHLLAHEGALERDIERLFECYERVNKSPMGAGALATSSFSLDRRFIASILGFDNLVENSLDAVSSRDFATESIYICSQLMVDLSRLAEEIIIWSSKEFSFATVSDKFSSTSSMMPQKKNPVVPEIARARTSQVLGNLLGALGIVKSLPLSYNLDLQELTRDLWDALDKGRDALSLFSEMVSELTFNEEEMIDAVSKDETLFATELADHLVKKYHLSFRDAHGKVAALVKYSESASDVSNAFTNRTEEELRSILGVSISKHELTKILNAKEFVFRRHAIGSPNPSIVKASCKTHAKWLSKQAKKLNEIEQKLLIARENLYSEVERLISSISMTKTERSEKKEKIVIESRDNAEVKQ